MPNGENTETPFRSNIQWEIEDLLTGQEPIAEITEVIFLLLAAAPDALPSDYQPRLYKLLALLNTMQRAQFHMERMVGHA